MNDRPADTYTHGHHASVVGMHATRTAANSAAYLLVRLRSGLDLLDIGCGPGTITVGLAAAVSPGRVVGIDLADEIIDQARANAAGAGQADIEFAVGDVYAIDAADASFDVVHAHQVLQHLTDPVRALREMGRVLRPGGLLAVRDADYGAMMWAPVTPAFDRWRDIYCQVARRNEAEPDAARHLLGWLHAAGFDDLDMTATTVVYADREGRQFWGGGWAGRAVSSAFASQAVSYGIATTSELEGISAAFGAWIDEPDGFWAYTNAEALAVKR